MAEIELPRAGRYAGGRSLRRGGFPTIADVPTERLAGDPGLRVPALGGGEGLVDAGRGLAAFAEGVGRAVERQQKLFSATAATAASLAYDRTGMEEFTRRRKEDDPSRPDFYKDFDDWLGKQAETTLAKLPKGVSSEAKTKLGLDLTRSRFGMARAAGELALVAAEKKAVDAISAAVNRRVGQVNLNPLFLSGALRALEDDIEPFKDTMSAEVERKVLANGGEQLIETAALTYASAGKIDDAMRLLKSGDYDSYLDLNARKRIEARIEQAKREAERVEREEGVRRRALVAGWWDDEIASRENEGKSLHPGAEEEIRVAYLDNPEHAASRIGRLRQAEKFYATRQAVAMNSPEQDETLLAETMKPGGQGYAQELSDQNELRAAIARKRAAIADDPVGYALAFSPVVREAMAVAERAAPEQRQSKMRIMVAALDDAQSLLGVPPHARRVLSKSFAEGMVAKLDALEPDAAVSNIVSLEAVYGKAWPRVYRDLVGAKLPAFYRVLVTIDSPTARRALAEAGKVGATALRKNLENIDAGDIDRAVEAALQPFHKTLALAPDGPGLRVDYDHAAKMLAYTYRAREANATDAATKAVNDLVFDHYAFSKDGWARVPKYFSAIAGLMATDAQEHLTATDIDIPRGINPETYVGDLKSHGRWFTNENGDGWFLVDNGWHPVMRKNGERVEIFWDLNARLRALAKLGPPSR